MLCVHLFGALLLGVSVTQGVLFPVNTVIQIVAAISWPVEVPDRKLFMNTGFQFNYNLANQLSTFYKPAFFPYSRALLDIVAGDDVGSSSSSNSGRNNGTDSGGDVYHHHPDRTTAARMRKPRHIGGGGAVEQGNAASARSSVRCDSDGECAPLVDVDKYLVAHRHDCVALRPDGRCEVQQRDDTDTDPHAADMSAGELYRSFADTLDESGFHRSCLEKSVCQLARHPLHKDHTDGDYDEDLLAEVLHFVLTPSAHGSFRSHEHEERNRYEAAESVGKDGGDCELVYAECEVSVLDYVTSLD